MPGYQTASWLPLPSTEGSGIVVPDAFILRHPDWLNRWDVGRDLAPPPALRGGGTGFVSPSFMSPVLRSPSQSSARTATALQRAAREADGVPGDYVGAPCGFRALDASEVSVEAPGPGEWVLVTCSGVEEEARQDHLRERCLTAAQRFILSLWSDGLAARWVDEGVPDADALRAGGLDLGREVPVGLVWIGAGR